MKKTITTYGLIAGAIAIIMWGISTMFREQIGYEKGMIIGYTSMILSLSVIFFAIQSYKNNTGNGYVSFKQAFKIGLWITLVSSFFYTICWLVIYYTVEPNIMDQYFAHMLEEMHKSGKSQAAIDAAIEQNTQWKEILKNPITNFLSVFFMEPFPVGLFISLIAAILLKSKKKTADLAVNG